MRTTQYQVGGVRTTEPWQRWSGGGQQPGSRGQESEQHQHTSRAQVWTRGACHVIHCAMLSLACCPVIHFAMLSFPVMLSGLFVHAIRMYDVKWWPIHIALIVFFCPKTCNNCCGQSANFSPQNSIFLPQNGHGDPFLTRYEKPCIPRKGSLPPLVL